MSRADDYELLPPDELARWSAFGRWEQPYYPQLVGVEVLDVRRGWCRMGLPWRFELTQPAGVVHGGAIATLVDTVVVPAIGTVVPDGAGYATVDLHVQYQGAVVQQDMVAEGWVTRQGRSIVFCEAEVRTARAGTVARGFMTYKVSGPRA